MSIQTVSSLVSRIFFFGAFVLLGLAVIERATLSFGYTVLREIYTPARLLELAAVLLFFVAALLLREIREELRSRGG
jgi:hypothetical protein